MECEECAVEVVLVRSPVLPAHLPHDGEEGLEPKGTTPTPAHDLHPLHLEPKREHA